MNRIQFIGLTQLINQDSINNVINFFDHTMAAYELVRDVNPTSMLSSTDEMNSSLKLNIESTDTSKLQRVVEYVNDTIHNHKYIYGKSFAVNAKCYGENQIELYVRNEM